MNTDLNTFNDLSRLLEELRDNSRYVQHDAKLLHPHIHQTFFGKQTQSIREHFDLVYWKISSGRYPLEDAVHWKCTEALQELAFQIFRTLSKKQLKEQGFSASKPLQAYILERLATPQS